MKKNENNGTDSEDAADEYGVEFDKEQSFTRDAPHKVPQIVQCTVKYSRGYIKNNNQARAYLLALVIIFFTISIILLYNSFGSSFGGRVGPADIGL